jgi:hypothetical protein
MHFFLILPWKMFVGGRMSYLRYLFLFAYSDFQHILCCVFVCFSSSCVPYVTSFSGLFLFVFLRLVYPTLPVSLDWFCFVFLRLVYPKLPVSLDCQFLIGTSVFSNVYLNVWNGSWEEAVSAVPVSINYRSTLNLTRLVEVYPSNIWTWYGL